MADAYQTGREGKKFTDTRMGRMVVDNGLVGRPDAGVSLWRPFGEAHEMGKRGYADPEHQHTVTHLRNAGLSLDDHVDQYDNDGNLTRGPNYFGDPDADQQQEQQAAAQDECDLQEMQDEQDEWNNGQDQ